MGESRADHFEEERDPSNVGNSVDVVPHRWNLADTHNLGSQAANYNSIGAGAALGFVNVMAVR